MARPRAFDEAAVLERAVACFWSRGYELTTIRHLAERTGLTATSLYNAFGDKRALFGTALDHYVETSIGGRIRRCEALPPREGLEAFFADILERSLADGDRRGCMLVNSALELAPYDAASREVVAAALERLELFFLACVRRGQADATIAASPPAPDLARMLLAALIGVRVLARVRPERDLLEGAVAAAFAALDPGTPPSARRVSPTGVL